MKLCGSKINRDAFFMKNPTTYYSNEKIQVWSDNHSPILFIALQSPIAGLELRKLFEVSKPTLNTIRKRFGQAFILIDCQFVTETYPLLTFLRQSLIIHNRAGLQAVVSPQHCTKEVLAAIRCIDQNLMPVFCRFESALANINELICNNLSANAKIV